MCCSHSAPCGLTTGPQCIAPGFPVEDEKILMPGMILSDGEKTSTVFNAPYSTLTSQPFRQRGITSSWQRAHFQGQISTVNHSHIDAKTSHFGITSAIQLMEDEHLAQIDCNHLDFFFQNQGITKMVILESDWKQQC